ncbi:MAG: hypothetical protein MJZ81_08740 [Bacteroidales bacterium]|nr:hypothetical protein [Bacteroidales bacterium]
MKIFVFNPEHDLCLANSAPSYMPPQSALRFAEDCCDIMQFLGDADDVCVPASRVGEACREHPEAEAIVPWGWNNVLVSQMKKQGVPDRYFPILARMDWIPYCSDRKHTSLYASVPRLFIETYCSEEPALLHSLQECQRYVEDNGSVVFKNPLSGSGRGIRPVDVVLSDKDREWIEKILKQRRYLTAEPRYEVVADFAALFSIDDEVRLEGYSLFDTKGFVYQGNLLVPDTLILETLGRYIPVDVIVRAVDNVAFLLGNKFHPLLQGKVGVDMFVFVRPDGSYGLSPMVELNCRYTMGFVAHELLRKHPELQGKRFQIHTPGAERSHYSYSIS